MDKMKQELCAVNLHCSSYPGLESQAVLQNETLGPCLFLPINLSDRLDFRVFWRIDGSESGDVDQASDILYAVACQSLCGDRDRL
jgi:hypothetical protein